MSLSKGCPRAESKGVLLALLLLLAACSGDAGGPEGIRLTAEAGADGVSFTIDGDVPLRGLVLDLAWDDGTTVSALEPGGDAGRLDLFAHDLGVAPGRARVVVSDSRRVLLPARGQILRVQADGAVRLTAVQAAIDGPGGPVTVEVALP